MVCESTFNSLNRQSLLVMQEFDIKQALWEQDLELYQEDYCYFFFCMTSEVMFILVEMYIIVVVFTVFIVFTLYLKKI